MSLLIPKKRVLFVRRSIPALLVLFGIFSLVVFNVSRPKLAAAATNNTINFQARLQSAAGAIVPDGNYNIEFKIYSASSGGTALWTEDYFNTAAHGLTSVNGYISANLGSITPFSGINWDQQLWMTMNVGGTTTGAPTLDGEMSPRLTLTAVPYAISAGKLQTTSGANTSTLSIQAPTGGSQIFQIQDQGAAGTYSLLTTNAANNSYIQLQASPPGTPQTGSLNISGTGTFGTVNATTIATSGTTRINSTGQLQNIAGYTQLTGDFTYNSVSGYATVASAAFQVSGGVNPLILATNTGSTNLIFPSSGFEGGLTNGWSSVGSGTGLAASLYGSPYYADPTSTLPNVYDGRFSYLVTTANGTANTGVRETGFATALTSSTVYTLSFYAKASGSSFSTLRAGMSYDGTTQTACSLSSTTVITTGYQRYTCTFTSGTISGSNYVFFEASDTSPHSFYIDDAQLTATSSATPFDTGSIQLSGRLSNPASFVNGSDSTTAFQIQNSAGSSNLFVADTLDSRIGIGTSAPAYTLDVAGTINATTVYTPTIDRATAGILSIGNTNATTTNISSNNTDHTINIGTGTGSELVNIGATTSASATIIQGGTAGIGFYVPTAGTFGFYQNSINTFSIDSVGRAIFKPSTNATSAFSVQNAAGSLIFGVDTVNNKVSTGSTGQLYVGSGGILSDGGLTLQGSALATYITPLGASLNTKINIPNYDPGSFSQIIAFGLPSTAQASARGILVADNRPGAHQPTIAILSPDENQVFGLSWDGSGQGGGSSTTAYLKNSANNISLQVNGVNALTATNNSGAGLVTIGGSLSVANGATLTNGGATVNTAIAVTAASSGNLGSSAATTVDVATTLNVTASSAGLAMTLYSPTSSGATGRIIYVSNVSPANSFKVYGVIVSPSTTAIFLWNGTAWTSAGIDGTGANYIQNGTTLQATSNFNISGTGVSVTGFQAPNLDTASAGTLSLGTGTANAISIGKTGVTTTVGGSLSVASGSTFTNASSTLNTAIPITNMLTGGSIGASAAVTVDVATTINIAQSTSGQTMTLFSPTVTTAGRVIYVSDTGSVSFKIGSVIVSPNTTAIFLWNGTVWTSAGIDGTGANYIQNTTTAQSSNLNVQAATSGTVAATLQANIAGSADVLDLLNGGGATVGSIGSTGNVLFKASAPSATAFQLQTATGVSFFKADSSKEVITTNDLNVGGTVGLYGPGRLFSDGFETGNASLWSLGSTTGGSSAITTDYTNPRNGLYAEKFVSNNGAATISTAITGGATTVMRGYAYVASSTTSNVDLMSLNNGTQNMTLYRDVSTGFLDFYNGASSSSVPSTTVMTTNAYHKIELVLTTNGASGSITVYLDNVNILSQTVNVGTTNPVKFVIGDSNTGHTGTFYIDDVAVDYALTGDSSSLNVNDSLHVSGSASFNSNVLVRSTYGATNAFQIQNASNVSLFNVDTTTNTITFGSAGNTVAFTAAGGLVYAGTAQHAKSLVLTPEYAGAVLDAASDTGGTVNCSTNNAGTLTSGYVATGRQNYYNWTVSGATAQCYDVVVQVPLPSDWASWNGAGSMFVYNSVGTDSTSVMVDAIDTTGTHDSGFTASTYSGISSGTTFSSVALPSFAGTYTAGGYLTFKVRVTSNSAKNVRVGNITLNYNSKF